MLRSFFVFFAHEKCSTHHYHDSTEAICIVHSLYRYKINKQTNRSSCLCNFGFCIFILYSLSPLFWLLITVTDVSFFIAL